MKFTQHYFEGTPDEFKAVAHLFQSQSRSEETKEKTTPSEPALTPVKAIRAMLTRIPVSNGQMDFYKALAHGQISYEQLLERMKRTPDVLAGVLGALSRRISQTPEFHQAGMAGTFDEIAQWTPDKKHIKLTEPALEALKAEGII